MASASATRSRAAPPSATESTAMSSRVSMATKDSRASGRSSTTSARSPRVSTSNLGGRASALQRENGTSIQKVLPFPIALSTPIRPPISSTRRREIASPSPVPPNLRVIEVSACLKLWNSSPCCSGVRPMPLSHTSKRTRSFVSSACTTSARSAMLPLAVNLTAFPAKLSRICCRRSPSP